MPETDRIAIDNETCNGDGVCVAVCPAQVYHQAEPGDTPTVARPDACIRCGQCVAACPTDAITVRGVRVRPFPEGGQPQPVAPDDLMALLTHRRSVRHMRDEPVPKDLIARVIEAASTAPTAKNMRAVRITVVRDAALRRALVDRCRAVYARIVRQMNALPVRVFIRLFRKEQAAMRDALMGALVNLVKRLEAGEDVILFDAPVTLVFSAPEAIGMSQYDCSYAVANAMLMAESLGLGTCVMGYFVGAARRDAEMRGLLQLPDYEQVFGALTVGYPLHAMQRQIVRRKFRTNRL